MPDRFEVIELRPLKKNCHILCSSSRKEDAERIVSSLMKNDPDLILHINRITSSPRRRKERVKRAEL